MLASCLTAENYIRWRIGKGELFFWHDCWMGDTPLVNRFPVFTSSMTRVSHFYDDGTWNVDKLNNVLQEDVVVEILNIPIDPLNDDRAFWVPTSDGQFTTKSAWEIVRQRQLDWIPVDLRLKTKGFQLASKCQHYNSEESLLHVMWECPIAVQAVPYPPKIFSWRKPSTGEFKLNVDGSSKHNFQNAAGGGLLRNHTGTLIFGFSENFGSCDSLQAELMALHRGLLLCTEYSVPRLWIEMDAKVVVHMINENHQGSSRTRYLLASIRRSLKSISFRISHIHREGNQAADHLANQGHTHQNLKVFSQAEDQLRGGEQITLVKVQKLCLKIGIRSTSTPRTWWGFPWTAYERGTVTQLYNYLRGEMLDEVSPEV
ncbi:Ribonuclease H domain - like 10 [Theobroma cacao]|nr:Ribonuclease H domain - like 10 [Theobroma cacao]